MKKIILPLIIILIILTGLYFLVLFLAPQPRKAIEQIPTPKTETYIDFPQFELELPQESFRGPTGPPQMKGPTGPPPLR